MRFPVSFSQQRLWFIDQLLPGEATFNMPYAMSLDGPIDPQALQRAMDALVARHGVLRTSIHTLDGVPEQVVADTGTVAIELVDIPPGPDADARAESIADEIARRPFDLGAGPLVRAVLIAVAPERHLFVLNMHHIISDGESMTIFMDELSAFYRAETTGEPVSLPTLWMQYGDFAAWQQDMMRGEELERQLAYWRQQLRGMPQVLNVPTSYPRPARLSSRGGVATVMLGVAATQRLIEIGRAVNATPFMISLAGFAAVLSRYARETDVVIGTQLAGRSHAELEPIIGMFTNTAPLRISMAGDPTFADLVGQVRDITLDALSHQQLPYEKLVEDLAPDRSLSHSPVIQVLFIFGSMRPPALDVPGVTARTRALLNDTAKLDLTIYADTEHGDAMGLSLEYSTDLFTPAWAERFLRCNAELLEHAASAPDTPVSELRMLSAAEYDALTGRRDGGPDGDGHDVDVRQLLRDSTSRVVDGDTDVPVSEVCDRAARIARTLAERGVGPETPVGLCVERGTGMLAALLGVWWAGGAYVPLDPDFPPARLGAMARGAGLRIVLSDSAHQDLAGSLADGVEVIRVDDPEVTAGPPLDPVPVVPGALAYVIFTSGSTGQPKGVAIEHRAVRNLVASFRGRIGLTADDRFVAVTTLSFDIALLELLLPLAVGADLVIATAQEAREPDRLRALVERVGGTAMQATPQTWRLLDSAGGVPSGLRLRLCGGEALPIDLADRLIAPGATLWNVYGPTETTVWSAAGVVTGAATAPEIGPPIDHTRVYVLDDHLEPVPVGVIGEVCLAGLGVARGYHDRPLLTARAFRPDPWGAPGARMYRTGDLGRWLEGGGLELIGRNDHQIKLRGYRIECGEIEAVLRAHRDVRQAAVVTADRGGEPALVAYIVPRRGSAAAQPDTDLLEHLRPHLRAALPDYMIPALVVALTALPVTPNAKVDRTALPAPRWGTSSSAAEVVEPRNPVEETLARIWRDLLVTESPIGVHDNLFALGGHSLTATRLVARVADAYHVSLPVHQVFIGPTIAQIAEAIESDPNFGDAPGSSRHAELDALSDKDLEELLQAAIAQRNRRQAFGGGPDV